MGGAGGEQEGWRGEAGEERAGIGSYKILSKTRTLNVF